MSDLYILRNQDGRFLGKQKDWLDGGDRGALYKTPHKDEAINQMVEINTKDYQQRITVVACETDERGLPVMVGSEVEPDLASPNCEHQPAELD